MNMIKITGHYVYITHKVHNNQYSIAGIFRRAKVSFFGDRLDFVGFNSVFTYN